LPWIISTPLLLLDDRAKVLGLAVPGPSHDRDRLELAASRVV
jgi:hypothetical protein